MLEVRLTRIGVGKCMGLAVWGRGALSTGRRRRRSPTQGLGASPLQGINTVLASAQKLADLGVARVQGTSSLLLILQDKIYWKHYRLIINVLKK